MISRVSFFNLIKNNIRRRIWVVAILIFAMMMTGPLYLLISYENLKEIITHKELIQNMGLMLRPSIIRDLLYTGVFSILIAFTQFSYVFSKNQIDFYHSAPIKREKLFVVNYVSGLIIQMVVLVLMLFSNIISATAGKYLTSEAFNNVMLTFWGDLVLFIYFYNIAILAIMLTGNLIVGLMGTAVLIGIYPLIAGIIEGLMGYSFVTFYNSYVVSRGLIYKYYFLSPLSSILRYVSDCSTAEYKYKSFLEVLIFLMIVLVAAVVSFIVAFYLYKNRKSESAGKSIAVKKAEIFIRVPIVIIGGLSCALIMSTVMTKYLSGWVWFALIVGCILTHFVLEMVFNIDYKAFCKESIQMLICTVVSVLIFVLFVFDVTGYDKYIPKKDKISKATVVLFDIDSDINYMTLKPGENGFPVEEYSGREAFMYHHIFEDKNMIEKIYDMTLSGIDHVDETKENRDNQNGEILFREATTYEVEEQVRHGNLIVRQPKEEDIVKFDYAVIFELKNGKTVCRRYSVPLDDIKPLIANIYDTKDFKTAHFDIFDAYEQGFISKIDVLNQFSEKQISLSNEDVDEFAKIYLSELMTTKVSDISEPPVGAVNFQFMTESGFEDALYGYYIYPGFTKTLNYIKLLNSKMDYMAEYADPSAVKNITINAYGYICDEDTGEDITVNDLNYSSSDPHGREMIELICKEAKLCNYSWSNYLFQNKEDRIEITVYYDMDDGIQKISSLSFKKNKIPYQLDVDIIKHANEQ